MLVEKLYIVFGALVLISPVYSKCVVREPPDALSPPQSDDAGFYLTISGNPEYYEAGQLYTVTLRGDKDQFEQKMFTEFLLVVENNNQELRVSIKGARTGSFQLLGDVLTRFSDHCTNTVTQTSAVQKAEIQVLWTAPIGGSGCVTFRATVVENQDTWAMDSGRLSLQLCEAKVAEHKEPDEIIEPCCACEEAKYEVTFEGLWSEETHPKSFPSSRWLLHFSDIIGASHSANYRVWEYGGMASTGLSQVAKWGSTRALESELKAESDHVRTIIKARGLWYPNVNGKTFAVFRTDRKNHLVSLVSMLGPSPDWIVGVSGLELCHRNCSWADSKELFLYPWDAGVDDGISYESPDSPTSPQQPITRITSRLPDDPRQPFWNETGAPMKPLAKLTVNRQRLYQKSCVNEDLSVPFSEAENDMYIDMRETTQETVIEDLALPGCEATTWGAWSDCSVTCGKGISMRTRSFVLSDKAKMLGCDRQLIQKEMCSASIPLCDGDGFYVSAPEDFLPDDMCATSEWSKWSDCSTTCGKGFESRVRRFFNRLGRKKCPHVETIDKRMCAGRESVCPQEDLEQIDPHCVVTSWSDWSPCSVTCGKGLKVRTRLYMVKPQQQTSLDCNVQLMEKSDCEGPRPRCEFVGNDAKLICSLSKKEGPCRGNFMRWYFDDVKKMCVQFLYGGCRGNSNNFERYEDCVKVCEVNAQMSAFSHEDDASKMEEDEWNDDSQPPELEIEEEFSHNDYEDADHIAEEKNHNQNLIRNSGGSISHLRNLAHASLTSETKEERKIRLMEEERQRQLERMADQQKPVMNGDASTIHPPVDCLVTAWSPWSACSATCGRAYRRQFRMIKRHHTPGGEKCPKKLEKRQKCHVPNCPQDCIFSEWSDWSVCSKSCGSDGVQERIREVETRHQTGSKACSAKVERRMCILTECPDP